MNITECERRVLLVISELKENGNLTAVCEGVNRRYNTQWSERAVKAFIKRLLKKKYILKIKSGNGIYYHMVFSQADIDKAALWDIRNGSFERDWDKMISYINTQQKNKTSINGMSQN